MNSGCARSLERAKTGPSTAIWVAWARMAAAFAATKVSLASISVVIRSSATTPGTSPGEATAGKGTPPPAARSRAKPSSTTERGTRFQ